MNINSNYFGQEFMGGGFYKSALKGARSASMVMRPHAAAMSFAMRKSGLGKARARAHGMVGKMHSRVHNAVASAAASPNFASLLQAAPGTPSYGIVDRSANAVVPGRAKAHGLGVRMKGMVRKGAFRAPSALNGELGAAYLRGDEYMGDDYMDGWLTNITKPISRTVRSVSSSAMGMGRTAVKAFAPAIVSAYTGRPVNVGRGGGQAPAGMDAQGNPVYAEAPKDNTLLYVGLGGAALVAVLFMSRKK